jgi:hypothetical protein
MNATQARAFMDAVEAAEVKEFTFESDLSSHFKNDGHRNIVKADYDKECMIAFRANKTFGGSVKTFAPSIEIIMSDFGDIHEARVGVNPQQAKKFIESLGGVELSDEDFKILLEIDGANRDINPVTGDYVNAFHYLTQKQYEQLSEEEKEEYDTKKADYEAKKASYLPKGAAAQITV